MQSLSSEHHQINVLQYGRGLAALFVCLYHTNILVAMFFAEMPGGQIFQAGHSGVEFFFILSGFIIFFAHRQDIGKPQRVSGFLTKRAIRLLPMFWLIVVPLGVLYLILPHAGEHADLTLLQFLGDLLLIPRPGVITLAPAWTLQHEVVFYGLFSLLLVNRRFGIVALVAWQVACLVYLVLGPAPQDYMNPLSKFLGFYNFGFAFGMLIAAFYMSGHFFKAARGLRAAAVMAAIALLVMYIGEWRFNGEFPPSDALRTLLYFVLYSAVILGALSLPQKKRPILDTLLAPLGAASYVLYLTHQAVSSVVVKVVNRLGLNLAASPVLAFVLVVAACIAAAIIIHWWVERPVLAALRRRFLARPTGKPGARG